MTVPLTRADALTPAVNSPVVDDVPSRALQCTGALLLLFGVACLLATLITRPLAFPYGHGASAAFPIGMLLAVLLLGARRDWWRWAAAATFASVAVDAGFFGHSIGEALKEAVCHAAGALLGAWLVCRVCGSPFQLRTLRDAVALSLLPAVFGSAFSATIELLTSHHSAPGIITWMMAWTGYALGGVMVAPLIVTAQTSLDWWRDLSAWRWAEEALIMLLTAAIAHFVFSRGLPLVYLLLPTLVWNALRFHTVCVMLGMLMVALIALYHTARGVGPYAGIMPSREMAALLVQSFLAVGSFGTFILSAVIWQRHNALLALRRAHEELESRVAQRTAEIEQSEARLRANEERFRMARGAARMIVIDWEVEPDVLTFSDSPEWLRGPLPASGRYPLLKDQIHPDDREMFLSKRQHAIDTLEGQTFVYRIVRTDGLVLHIQSDQAMVAGPDGKAVRLIAIHQDVTERCCTESALRESEQRLRAVLDALPDQVRLKDRNMRYLMVNRAAREYLGASESQIIGHTIFELRPPEIARQIDEADRAMFAKGEAMRTERPSFFETDNWREVINYPIRDAHGEITGLVSIGRDITERKKAELDALREREERYRTLVEQAGDLIYRTNTRGYFTYTNSTAPVDMLGYARDELIGHHYLEFVRKDYHESAQAFYTRQFKERIPATYLEMPVIAKDGRTIWVGQRVQLVIENEWVLYYQAVCRDITDRVAAQQALREFNTKLRQLTARQEDMLEAERTRIAHDLHDSVGQSLNLARIRLSGIAAREPADSSEGAEIREVLRVIDETSAVIRTLEFDLSPPVLRELGLEPALEWLAEEMRRIYGLKVGLSSDGEPKVLPQGLRAVAFRSVRELLINVVRHSGTLEAHVDTQLDNGFLVITVSDEGKGFDPATAARGLGLTSVNERMTHIGGSATISGMAGEGAVVTLLLPHQESTDSRKEQL